MAPRRPQILIVDDEPRNLSLLEALLTGSDAEIVRAPGGRAGVETFLRMTSEGGVDLVLLDVMMPDVDGLTALGQMRRATAPGEHVPIILVTALGAREDRMRGLEAGADDFLAKPLDTNEVRCRVRTFLALRTAQHTLRQRAEELEELQRAKAELTRMIVHDLKNPLAGVGSNIGWIERRLRKSGNSDRELLEALADARGGADRLLALVGGLIDIEKAETGQLVVQRRTVRVGDLLHGVGRRHSKEAEANQLRLIVEGDLDAEGELDADLIARVLENLVENATRFTPKGGRILLAARRAPEGIELTVANDGAPIPPGARARIFDKHVSGEQKALANRHLGLGLYFCKLATAAHDGEITVDSTPEWPTRFTVRLGFKRVSAAPRSVRAFLD